MSMPVIRRNEDPITFCQAIADLIESIALEETALSHILNAEGEKIQRVLALECVDFCQLMEVNESVANMVAVVSGLEQALKEKLEFISTNLYYPAMDMQK